MDLLIYLIGPQLCPLATYRALNKCWEASPGPANCAPGIKKARAHKKTAKGRRCDIESREPHKILWKPHRGIFVYLVSISCFIIVVFT